MNWTTELRQVDQLFILQFQSVLSWAYWREEGQRGHNLQADDSCWRQFFGDGQLGALRSQHSQQLADGYTSPESVSGRTATAASPGAQWRDTQRLFSLPGRAYSSLILLLIHVWDGFMGARVMGSKTWVPWKIVSEFPKELFKKYRCPRPAVRYCDSGHLGWDLAVCI